MKLLIVLMMSLFSVNSFAKSRSEKEAEKIEMRNAKIVCLMNDNLMRGKRLKDCIKEEMQKNKMSDLKADRKTRQSL